MRRVVKINRKMLFKRYKAHGFSSEFVEKLDDRERRALDEYMRYAFRER